MYAGRGGKRRGEGGGREGEGSGERGEEREREEKAKSE